MITLFLAPFGKILLQRVLLCRKGYKPEFKEAEETVYILYFQQCLWLSLILCPSVTLIQPILVWILFQAYYVSLNTMWEKAVSLSNLDKSSLLIESLLTASCFIFIFCTTVNFVIPFRHMNYASDENKFCGPIASNVSQQEIFLELISRFKFLAPVFKFFYDYMIVFIIIFFVMMKRKVVKSNTKNVKYSFIKKQLAGFQQEATDLQKNITKKNTKIEVL